MSHQTSHLGVLVIRPEVEMQSALSLLALIKPDEVQPRHAIRLRADLELVSRGVDHNPTKSLGPPLPQGHRIYRVNNYLFPFQGHPQNLDLPGFRNKHFSSEKTLVTDYVFSPPATFSIQLERDGNCRGGDPAVRSRRIGWRDLELDLAGCAGAQALGLPYLLLHRKHEAARGSVWKQRGTPGR